MKRILCAFALALFLTVGFLPVVDVLAQKRIEDLLPAGTEAELPMHMVGVEEAYAGDASDATNFIQRIGNGLVAVLASVAILFVVLSAFDLLMAAGSSDKIAKAKKALTWVMLGLLTVIGAYVVVKTAVSTPFLGS